ncbi:MULTISPECIES: head maturation protease, ClpP-related [Bacillus]|uniref:head maturation protease, ClpP-related n=1 Tax=Bacillus TaxID=1386 RepID=UPI000367BD4A|nr:MULTISPECIES: head maturation protease, ClpP-related [Bacillus]KJE33557.1 serine dehydrogenase ase family protein [Bacillus licheniformis]MBC9087216.1 Clp protease ClpP [Bacillus sp. Y1]MDE1428499.1 Clp protease ClpP [Bacillus licheniformis]MDE1458704.1 Clp protease ClpP [Bacillus licheniformis]MEC1040751.1 Clp protease ClpP [Bacillus licheniformis]
MATEQKKKNKYWNMKVLNDSTAEITLYGSITGEGWFSESSSKAFQAELKSLGDVSSIDLYINSPGGDVFEGQAIHSMLQRHKAKINVYVDALAGSIASVIAMAGDIITMPSNAMMMIHNPYMGMVGNAAEFRKAADDLDKITESIVSTYLAKAGDKLDDGTLRQLLDEETWLTADEALNYGLIDMVSESKDVAACIDHQVLAHFKHVPGKIVAQSAAGSPAEETKPDEVLKQKITMKLELLNL